MNRREFFENQELKKDDVNDAFDLVSNSLIARLNDVETSGILHGCAIDPTVISGWNLTINNGSVIAADHINYPGGVTDISLDYTGASTLPSAGNYRWVTVAIRYGQLLASSVVDGLGVTVYQHRTDSYNLNGTSLLADATATTNNAGDAKLMVVAGTQAAIGSALSLSGVPGDAVILCDILVTNGQSHIDFAGGAVYFGRRLNARSKVTSAGVYPHGFRTDYDLLSEIEGGTSKVRFYRTSNALVVTVNAAWTPETTTTAVPTAPAGVWTADFPNTPAAKYTITDGLSIERKYFSDTGTPWTDASQSTSGWDSYFSLDQNATRSLYAVIDGSGNTTGKGAINGYVSLAATGPALSTAIQFPRTFQATPSSVTLGVAGPNEVINANVSSVSTGNLSPYGCDFNVIPISGSSIVQAQRQYTATQ